ncbi:hypothetical protein EIMP300_08760 [Escherichia coli]|uniref:branched-chain-amino-acid transaminase n=1 Tax=Escherichia coli TaxID=562 RepID=A0A8S0FG89_ECOLX|nr:hypothetical protein EIMP300_08760 [Escherichia coli]
MVGSEARRHGYQEGIALDVNGYISEGAGENLFEVKDGVLFTPPFTSSALPGITRDAIIKLAKELGIEVREQVLSRESLYLADEVFMSGTAAEITPVRSVDGIQVGEGRCGPVTKRIQQAFFGLFTGETEDKWGWLDQVTSSINTKNGTARTVPFTRQTLGVNKVCLSTVPPPPLMVVIWRVLVRCGAPPE